MPSEFAQPEHSALLDIQTVGFECLCAIPANSPLSLKTEIGAHDLDGLPMGSLLEDHATSQLLTAAFLNADAQLNLRYLTQYFMPLLNFVESGTAHVVLDPLSAESYRIYRGENTKVVFRRFRPAIPLNVAILTPRGRTMSLIAHSFRERVVFEMTRIASEALG